MRTLSIALACVLFTPWSPIGAEEGIKYPSPDGRFALRITQSKKDEDHPTVDLIEKGSGKVMVTLHNGSDTDTDAFSASDSILVWSADSKRVAYGFRANPPGARVEELRTLVCFWNGSGFDKVFLPEDLPTPYIEYSRRARRHRETLWRRRDALKMVEIRRTAVVERGDDVLAS